MLFEIAHCLWIRSFFYSNFEKQNRKGSPTSLIYPYIGKLTSFVIKQFFRFGKEHQTLSRSRLRRFCSERCIAADADQKANCFYAAVCTLLSPQNFDSRSAFAQDDQVGGRPFTEHYCIPPTSKTASCFCWVLFDSARLTRRVGMLRDDIPEVRMAKPLRIARSLPYKQHRKTFFQKLSKNRRNFSFSVV